MTVVSRARRAALVVWVGSFGRITKYELSEVSMYGASQTKGLH